MQTVQISPQSTPKAVVIGGSASVPKRGMRPWSRLDYDAPDQAPSSPASATSVVTPAAPAPKRGMKPRQRLDYDAPCEPIQGEASQLGIKPKLASACNSAHISPDSQVRCGKNVGRDDFISFYWQKKDFRYFLAARQREFLFESKAFKHFKSLVHCHRVPVPATVTKSDGEVVETGAPGTVQVCWYPGQENETTLDYASKFSFAWLKKCGSGMNCFLCAPMIRYFRSKQINETVYKMINDYGYGFFMTTFTAPHNLSTNPVEQRKLFSTCKKEFQSGRFWKDLKEEYGLGHHITVVEMTCDAPWSDKKSGTHYHNHVLNFYKKNDGSELTEGEADELAFKMGVRWASILSKHGLCNEDNLNHVLEHGFRLDLPRKPKNSETWDRDAISKYLAKGASIEMSPSMYLKSGKHPNRVSHFQFYTLALTDFPELKPDMLAVMYSLKGVHWVHFSKGLLELCDMEEEDKEDEDIVIQECENSFYSIEDDEIAKIDTYKAQSLIIQKVQTDLEKEGIDLNDVPFEVDDDNNRHIDLSDPKVIKIQKHFREAIDQVVAGINPATGEILKECRGNPAYYAVTPPPFRKKRRK